MVLAAKHSGLVAGAQVTPTNMDTMTIKVLRPLMWNGKRQEAGAILVYPYGLAVEAINMGKAERHVEPAPKPTPPKAAEHKEK
jgi:hypothetical protein